MSKVLCQCDVGDTYVQRTWFQQGASYKVNFWSLYFLNDHKPKVDLCN